MRRRMILGFTLVELLVVVLILGALAFVAIPRISESAGRAKAEACKTNVDLINSQIELYYATEGAWPTSTAAITGNTDYFPDGAPACPYEGTFVYEYSTTTKRVAGHSH